MATTVKEGTKAPSFTLYDTERKPRELGEFRKGNIVLAFFPGAFTAPCTKELCTFRDSLSKLNALNANVVAVSVNDPFTNKAFAEKNSLNFPILSDYERKVIGSWGIFHEDFVGLKGYTAAKRSVFVMDRTGTVRYVWVSEDPGKEPNYGEIESKLKEIK